MTIRLADSPPVQCAVCFGANHDPGFRHIDFDAAADRGYGEGPYPVSMDEIVVCELCVQEAARLLDWEDAQTLADVVVDLQTRLREAEQEAERWQTYADRLDDAFNVRPPDDGRKRPRRPREAQPA